MTFAVLRPNTDPDAVTIGALYQLGRKSMVDSVHHLIEAGQRLDKKKDEVGRGNWIPWLSANAEILGFGERTAQLLMNAASKYEVDFVFDEIEARKANRLIWGNNVRGTQGTGENEWFTPGEYIARARECMGDIDLDPASSDAANEVVKARDYFTETSDGLVQEWHGRIWLNPPYAQPLIADFIHKLCEEWRTGRVTSAIALTHNYTDTAWFHELADSAAAICFTRGRIGFLRRGEEVGAPTQGQAFSYFGVDAAWFARVFAPVGFVVCPWGQR